MSYKKIIWLLCILILLGIARATWDAPLNSELVAYYSMNATSGTNALDSVNGTYNGTLLNGVTLNKLGIINGSFGFDGVNDYINLTQPTLTCIGDKNCTISLWINTTIHANKFIWYQGNGTSTLGSFASLSISGSAGTLLFQAKNETGGQHNVISLVNVSTGRWTHIVAGLNTTSQFLYINNTLSGQALFNGTMPTGQVEFFGARAPEATDFYTGLIDEVGIWNKSLSAAEISNLYNNGNGLAYNPRSILITAGTPADSSNVTDLAQTFNASLTAVGVSNLYNATLWIYTSNGTLLSNSVINLNLNGTQNNTNLNVSLLDTGGYVWNVFACSVTSFCQFSPSNFTLNLSYNIISEFWRNNTANGNIEFFQINVTIPSNRQISTGTLRYNNTNYTGTISQIAGNNYSISRSLAVDSVPITAMVNFNWTFVYDNGFRFSSVTKNQTISTFNFDDCTTNPIVVLNYSVKDEDSLLYLGGLANGANVSVDVDLISLGTNSVVAQFNHTYYILNATQPARVCITGEVLNTTSYRLDSTASYISASRVLEYHNIQNHTLNNNSVFARERSIDLFDLLVTRAQQFLITFKDSNFIPVGDAIIQIDRQYLGDGIFRTIEIPKTDQDGRTIGNLVLNDEVYTLYVKKNGVLLATFPNIRAFCSNIVTGDCRINLNAESAGNQLTSVSNLYNVSYGLTYTQSTRTITFIFATTDSTTKFFELNVTKFDNYLNQSLCTASISTSSGVLNCPIASSVGNVSVQASIFADGNLLSNSIFKLNRINNFVKSKGIYILAFLLIVSIPLLAFTSGVGTIVFFFIGLLFASFIILIDLGGYIGALSAFMWFIIAGGVLLWKATHKED